MSKNTYMDLFGNQEICLIFVEIKTNKMKNLFLLPTDKPSKLIKLSNGELRYNENSEVHSFLPQNIYITSDEEIKEGDRYLDKIQIIKAFLIPVRDDCKKIILTTDLQLIEEGVQAIPDEFLEWFVKNPSCEFVEIINTFDYIKKGYVSHSGYKITIPKEEKDYTALLQPVGTKQTPMQDLREDLILTQTSAKESLLEIENQETRNACQEVVRLTLSNIIKRIDEELLDMEKENMINFLKSVFQQDGFDYEKAFEQFKNK